MFQTLASVSCGNFKSLVTRARDTLVPILLSACQMVYLQLSNHTYEFKSNDLSVQYLKPFDSNSFFG